MYDFWDWDGSRPVLRGKRKRRKHSGALPAWWRVCDSGYAIHITVGGQGEIARLRKGRKR